VFHERTKHIEVNSHYVRDKFKIGQVRPCDVSSKNQLVDLFTKVVSASRYVHFLATWGLLVLRNHQLEGECWRWCAAALKLIIAELES